jgi:hypothetical protein
MVEIFIKNIYIYIKYYVFSVNYVTMNDDNEDFSCS